MRRRDFRFVSPFCLIGLGWLGLLCGCGPKIGENLRPVPTASENYYRKAHASYADILMKPRSGPQLAVAMKNVVGSLEAAASNAASEPGHPNDSYSWPLSRSKLGDVCLTFADGQQRAYELLELSVSDAAGCPHWIPGWIGLAAWATRQEPFDPQRIEYAYQCLAQAEKRLEELKKKTDPQKKNMGPLSRITTTIENMQQQEDADGPKATEPQRLTMLWQWMMWNEQWWDGNYLLAAAQGAKVPAPVGIESVYRRLRARIEYQKAAILIRAQDPADSHTNTENTVMAALDRSLQWDPNYFEARLDMAAQLHRVAAGRPECYSKAEAWLRPYVDPDGNPYFRNNLRLWLEVGTIYEGWYAVEPGADRADAAEAAFRHLLADLDENHPGGNLGYARLLTLKADREKKIRTTADRTTMLNEANALVEHARQCGVNPALADAATAEIARVRAELEKEPGT